MFVLGFPLLLIPFAVYNIIAFITPGVSWTATVTTVHMMSGQDWVLTWEDFIVGVAILLLAVEIMKATRIGIRTIIDHMIQACPQRFVELAARTPPTMSRRRPR